MAGRGEDETGRSVDGPSRAHETAAGHEAVEPRALVERLALVKGQPRSLGSIGPTASFPTANSDELELASEISAHDARVERTTRTTFEANRAQKRGTRTPSDPYLTGGASPARSNAR